MARIAGITPKMAEIGKIKIGMHSEKKTTSGHNLPMRLNSFLVTTTQKDQAGVNFLPDTDVMATLGENPTSIPIVLPFDDPDLCFMTSYAVYQGRQCQCRGDGNTAEMLFQRDGKPAQFTLLDTEELGDTVKTGERRRIKCDPRTCPLAQPDAKGVTKCKPNGRLCCIIPASKRLNGFYFFRTTSFNTISFILSSLDAMKIQSNGILRGIPAKLFFFKKNTAEHGNVPVVTVDWDFDGIQKMREAAKLELENRTKFGIDIKLIEARARESGILDDTDDPEDVEREFYPQNTAENKAQDKKIASDIQARSDAILATATEAASDEPEPEPEPEQSPGLTNGEEGANNEGEQNIEDADLGLF